MRDFHRRPSHAVSKRMEFIGETHKKQRTRSKMTRKKKVGHIFGAPAYVRTRSKETLIASVLSNRR